MHREQRVLLAVVEANEATGTVVLQWVGGEVAVQLSPEEARAVASAMAAPASAPPSIRDMWRQTLGTFDGLPLEASLDFSGETVTAKYVVLADGMPVSLGLPVRDALVLAAQSGTLVWGTGLSARETQQNSFQTPTLAPSIQAFLGGIERSIAGRPMNHERV